MKIKRYFPTVDLPSTIPFEAPRGDVLAKPAEAIGGVGRAIKGGGQAIADFVEEKIRLDNELDFADGINQFRQRAKNVEIQLQKNPDETTHIPKLRTRLEEIRQHVLRKSKETKNLELYAALSKAIEGEITQSLNAGKDFAFKTYLAKAGGKYLQALFDYTQQYITSDQSGRARISGEAETLIRATAISLGRDPNADLRMWEKNAAIGAIKNDAIIDPRGTITKIQTGFYKGIPEEDKPALIKMCEQLAKTQDAEAQKVRIDSVTKELMAQYETDFDQMFKKLTDPQFLKYHNLTVQEAHSVETVLRSKQQNHLAAKQQVYHKTGQEALVLLAKGELTPQQIIAWVAEDQMTDEQGRIYLNAIEAKASSARTFKTNNAVFIQRFNQIHAAGGNDEKLLKIQEQLVKDAKNGYFTHGDYVQLWNLTEAQNRAVFSDDYFKMTDAWFKQQLGFQTGIISALGEIGDIAPNPEAAQAYVRAKLELVKAYKEDQLRGPELFEEGVKILGAKKLPLTELLSGKKKQETPKQVSPTIMREAPVDVFGLLPDPKEYYKEHGTIPLRDKETGLVYKTDGKTWWELKK